ncbi:hypothetical protein JF66_15475 [Cryobacterium sp. MLB-32]|nr:hypothetical protein JF66_15475 [Cryobacterium sp. MLB-32]
MRAESASAAQASGSVDTGSTEELGDGSAVGTPSGEVVQPDIRMIADTAMTPAPHRVFITRTYQPLCTAC